MMASLQQQFTKNIFPILGFSILTGVFYLSLLFYFGMYFGNMYVRVIFILIYIYQCTYCKSSQKFRDLVRFLKPYDYFYSNGTIFEEETPFAQKNKIMLAMHPHGIMATSFPLNYCRSKHFENFHFLATRLIFYIPFGGIFARWIGIEPVDNKSFENLLEKGENIIFLPGGFEDATITNHNQDQIFIKNRKGFVKYALKYGYNLYPGYSFNENRMFSCFTSFENFRLFLNRIKFPGVFFWGKYGLLPRRDLKMYTVIGKPLILPKLEKITNEDVDKYHNLYLEKLQELYDKYKDKFECSSTLIMK